MNDLTEFVKIEKRAESLVYSKKASQFVHSSFQKGEANSLNQFVNVHSKLLNSKITWVSEKPSNAITYFSYEVNQQKK